MATVDPTITDISGNGQVIKFDWPLTTADNDGAPIPAKYAEHADRTVYFLGTWGGATAAWEGGDGVSYVPITDAQGSALTKTADGIEVAVEVPEFSRPRLSTVGSGATITATCIARRGYPRGG